MRKKKTVVVYIKAALRRIWGWDLNRAAAKKRAQINKGRPEIFKCEKCGIQPLRRDDVQIDHVVPVEDVAAPVNEISDNWSGWIQRLFCPAEGLMILCKPCHVSKSTSENSQRRSNKKKVA